MRRDPSPALTGLLSWKTGRKVKNKNKTSPNNSVLPYLHCIFYYFLGGAEKSPQNKPKQAPQLQLCAGQMFVLRGGDLSRCRPTKSRCLSAPLAPSSSRADQQWANSTIRSPESEEQGQERIPPHSYCGVFPSSHTSFEASLFDNLSVHLPASATDFFNTQPGVCCCYLLRVREPASPRTDLLVCGKFFCICCFFTSKISTFNLINLVFLWRMFSRSKWYVLECSTGTFTKRFFLQRATLVK